jgi:hypothetical protein
MLRYQVKAETKNNTKGGEFTGQYNGHLTDGWGNAVAQLVEALHYKPEGRGFDSRWCHWIFSLT